MKTRNKIILLLALALTCMITSCESYLVYRETSFFHLLIILVKRTKIELLGTNNVNFLITFAPYLRNLDRLRTR